MIDANTIRDALNRHMQKGRQYMLKEIYVLVSDACRLDSRDLDPSANRPSGQCDRVWMRQVRNVLNTGLRRSQLDRTGRAVYKRCRRLD